MSSCSVIRQVPGPRGRAGTNGTNGTDGANAFSITTAPFVMPAPGVAVEVLVDDNSWMSPTASGVNGQVVHVQGAGYMRVSNKVGTTSVDLTNLGYTGNAADGTTIASSARVAPAGLQGESGNDGADGAPVDAPYWVGASNATLSGEIDMSAIGNGLLKVSGGTPSVASDGTDYLSPSTGLRPADIGTTVQAWDALLDAIAALPMVADRLIYGTGANTVNLATLTSFARTLLDDTTAAQARSTLGVMTGYGLLASLDAVDANTAGDSVLNVSGTSRYRIDKITVDNASISLDTATAGVFTAAGGGGTTLAADQALSALTATSKFKDLTLDAGVVTDVRTEATLYFRIGTPQGAAATVNVRVFGWKLD